MTLEDLELLAKYTAGSFIPAPYSRGSGFGTSTKASVSAALRLYFADGAEDLRRGKISPIVAPTNHKDSLRVERSGRA